MNRRDVMRRMPPFIMAVIVFIFLMMTITPTFSSSTSEAIPTEPEPTVAETVAPEPVKLPTVQNTGTLIQSRDWGADDSAILLQIAMAEAEGESTEGKALVMLVVLNRVWSEGFPDTISDVVFQQYDDTYQFSPVVPGGRYWTTEPNEDCYTALDMVLNGWDKSEGALYFEGCVGDSWHRENLEYLFTEGGHRFYK